MDMRNDRGEAAAAFYDKRRRWLDHICTRADLSDRAFRIGFWLAKRMNGDNQACWYTHDQIADRFGISVDTVSRGIAELENANVMTIVREHRKANVYYIRLPFDFG